MIYWNWRLVQELLQFHAADWSRAWRWVSFRNRSCDYIGIVQTLLSLTGLCQHTSRMISKQNLKVEEQAASRRFIEAKLNAWNCCYKKITNCRKRKRKIWKRKNSDSDIWYTCWRSATTGLLKTKKSQVEALKSQRRKVLSHLSFSSAQLVQNLCELLLPKEASNEAIMRILRVNF